MPKDSTIRITAVGDLMFYGSVAEALTSHEDPFWIFGDTLKALNNCDILFGNFESPISALKKNEPDAPSRYAANPGAAKIVKDAGFDVVNLANNHIYDFGKEGVECTIQELKEAGLPHMGIGTTAREAAEPAIIKTSSGISVGFLGYTTAHVACEQSHEYVACFPNLNQVGQDIEKLKKDADIIVVSCHTGTQYNHYPAPETRKLAEHCINNGALLFLGHHPHVSGGVEQFKNGLAVYSLGDFVTPVHTEACRHTYAIEISLSPDEVQEYSIIPCYIEDEGRTSLATGQAKQTIIDLYDEVNLAIKEGKSDARHFAFAEENFFGRYVTSWIREFRYGGIKFLIRKVSNFRYYHFQLLFRIIKGKITGLFRRS